MSLEEWLNQPITMEKFIIMMIAWQVAGILAKATVMALKEIFNKQEK